jgi:hypothetical protein
MEYIGWLIYLGLGFLLVYGSETAEGPVLRTDPGKGLILILIWPLVAIWMLCNIRRIRYRGKKIWDKKASKEEAPPTSEEDAQ